VARPVILCVDDEPIVLSSLKRQLIGAMGSEFAIETAQAAEEALELLDELGEEGVQVPLVISDHMMPGMRGAALLIELQQRRPQTFKVLLTGQADADSVGSVVNAGALYRYIGKPWQQDDLVLTVREACRGFFRDLQLEEQNRELRHARATLQRLVAGIAHEANTPIGAIVSSSALLGRSTERATTLLDQGDTQSAAKALGALRGTVELIQKAGGRLGSLIASTQRFVSLDEAERGVVDVVQRVEDALTLMAAAADDRDMARADSHTEPLDVMCYPAQLSEVFVNRLSNAVAATEPGGVIRAAIRGTNEGVEISVQDDGRGMSAEQLRDVFMPGFSTRSEDGRTRMRLGLTLCKRYIESIDGSIRLESELGKGTTAIVTLPRHHS
jgi:signal transduction histidine kinase